MTSRRPSRAEVRRRAERAVAATNVALPPRFSELLEAYRPEMVADDVWSAISEAHTLAMSRAQLSGVESFKKHLGVVAIYLGWRFEQHLSLAVEDAWKFTSVDSWYVARAGVMSDRTRNDYRSRLMNVARKANPGLDAPTQAVTAGHRSVRPAYSPMEMHLIRHAAERHGNNVSRRRLCAVVGLCGGAGLDSSDLRSLVGGNIVDFAEDGIRVDIGGRKPRTVWVRRGFEELVRVGLRGIAADQLVIGQVETRRNIVCSVVEKAYLFDDVPHIDASRLRSTWLVSLMSDRVPVGVILQAAGLQSARSLTELVASLPRPDATAAAGLLRGEPA